MVNDPTWVKDMSSSADSKTKRMGMSAIRSCIQLTWSKSKTREQKTMSAPFSAPPSASGCDAMSLSVQTQISSPGHCSAARSAARRYSSRLNVSNPARSTILNLLSPSPEKWRDGRSPDGWGGAMRSAGSLSTILAAWIPRRRAGARRRSLTAGIATRPAVKTRSEGAGEKENALAHVVRARTATSAVHVRPIISSLRRSYPSRKRAAERNVR
mmetsp:Transcript_59013/g.140375  ORF Transcript_59013/g.140375 Transcript_59013/m.140375 type:complete len:213 (-) Transcript_59013:34-672(-)